MNKTYIQVNKTNNQNISYKSMKKTKYIQLFSEELNFINILIKPGL